MNKNNLKIGVVGAGVFGGYHATKCVAHPRLDFVGIFDPNHDKVRVAAKKYGARPFDNYNTLLSGVDAVIVACPAIHHGPIAVAALKAGRHVLVEKPIAADLDMANTMVALAREHKLVLQVGHQERFVARAIGLDGVPEKPMAIRATRFGPVARRGTDVSVTLDLMIHDLDMALWLMGEKPVTVRSDTQKVYSQTADAARADLVWGDGRTARLEASRCEDAQQRIVRITYPSGHVVIDFVNKTLENKAGFDLNKNFASDPSAKDALGAATNAFTASVLDGTPVAVPGEAGRDALELALEIDGS